VTEGFEEVFEEFESERRNPSYLDEEISAIVKEAIDPMMKNRSYGLEKNDSLSKVYFFNYSFWMGKYVYQLGCFRQKTWNWA
jgi:hypothetical protein